MVERESPQEPETASFQEAFVQEARQSFKHWRHILAQNGKTNPKTGQRESFMVEALIITGESLEPVFVHQNDFPSLPKIRVITPEGYKEMAQVGRTVLTGSIIVDLDTAELVPEDACKKDSELVFYKIEKEAERQKRTTANTE